MQARLITKAILDHPNTILKATIGIIGVVSMGVLHFIGLKLVKIL